MVARLCDWAFISLSSLESAQTVTSDIKSRARGYGRSVQCAAYPFVLWRDTEKEADAERRRIIDQIDLEAVKNWATGLNLESGSFNQFTFEMLALGGGALPIIGSREQVAEKLAQLYHSGIDGILMEFLSYYDDTLRFAREIMPLLRHMEVIK